MIQTHVHEISNKSKFIEPGNVRMCEVGSGINHGKHETTSWHEEKVLKLGCDSVVQFCKFIKSH